MTPQSVGAAVRHYAAANYPRAASTTLTPFHASVLLKPYQSPEERGLILIHFEHELKALLSSGHFEAIEERYGIIFMSSWVSAFGAELCELSARAKRRFWVLPSLLDETDRCGSLGPLCAPLPFHSASWLNPDHFQVAKEKSTDLLMLANFAPFKRHWKFFEAVSQMPEGITAEVIGSPIDSRTLDDVVAEARMFGVADRVTFRVNPPRSEITAALAQSRIFCAMSLVEGSYVAAVEAMMSDTPVAMFSNARVGSRAYVNAETGRLLDPGAAIGPQLLEMLSNAAQFRPAQWARGNVSAAVQCRLFNDALRKTAEGRWSADIRSFYQRRQMKLYFGGDQEEQELRGEYEDLRQRYGIDMRRLPQYPVTPAPLLQ